MIRLFLGKVGAGKSISAIKEMQENKDNEFYPVTFSNIKTNGLNNILITRDMLVHKIVTGTKRNGEETYKLKFNLDFWKEQKKKYRGFNVVIDEAHTLMNSRKSMSRQNQILSEFLALIRKIAQDPIGQCHLTLISQQTRKLDANARDDATQIRYHVCIYDKICNSCGTPHLEHNETPEPITQCFNCGSHDLKKDNHRLLVWFFRNIDDYEDWQQLGEKKFYNFKKIYNIKEYFNLYDTLQLDNLISED